MALNLKEKILTGKIAQKICNQILKSAKDDGTTVSYPKHENACGYYVDTDGKGKNQIIAFANKNCKMWMQNFLTVKEAIAYCRQ